MLDATLLDGVVTLKTGWPNERNIGCNNVGSNVATNVGSNVAFVWPPLYISLLCFIIPSLQIFPVQFTVQIHTHLDSQQHIRLYGDKQSNVNSKSSNFAFNRK